MFLLLPHTITKEANEEMRKLLLLGVLAILCCSWYHASLGTTDGSLHDGSMVGSCRVDQSTD
jgi:hypothetical protein